MSNRPEQGQRAASDDESERLTHERWTRALEAGEPMGLSCGDCGYVTGTPKAACVRCGSRDVSTVSLPTSGTVYTKSTIEIAPGNQGRGYQIALIDLGDARMLGRIADGDHVEIDDTVELTGTYEYDGDIVGVFEAR
ncbi:Zn-ribbon domain-containing OB-fold protein [Halomarina oriensis]|uniref:DUF35 domain-containing protein n=1 Tax=Halomarina oriensis TaxID=671145 RepID=A0A6B0GMU2_9EURY|nr:hypothetical protein [Halomarina oriensis]MWG33445.1 hypothetical protein [Halomarina oriensis]